MPIFTFTYLDVGLPRYAHLYTKACKDTYLHTDICIHVAKTGRDSWCQCLLIEKNTCSTPFGGDFLLQIRSRPPPQEKKHTGRLVPHFSQCEALLKPCLKRGSTNSRRQLGDKTGQDMTRQGSNVLRFLRLLVVLSHLV